MSRLGRILLFFPAFHGAAIMAALTFLFIGGHNPECLAVGFAALVFAIYGLPVLCFRVHQLFFPIRDGFTEIDDGNYSPWWGSHQIQALFIAFPFLEAALRLLPGVFSFWLRLWGAKIGRGIYWTPLLQVVDRPLLQVGDGAIFGHDVILCMHVIMRNEGKLRLLVARIRIGDHVLVGAHSALGPGVKVESGVTLPYNTEGWIRQVFRKEAPPSGEKA